MIDIAYVALGSNMGDRRAYLAHACAALAALPQTRLLSATAVEETPAIGFVPQAPYLNQMVALETALSPLELLERLHDIERAAGRERHERWGPRTLDLDIVMFERQAIADPALTVPHPEFSNRDFWQRELQMLRGKR